MKERCIMKTILITGGAGFIGSHVVRLFVKKYPDYHIINLDKLTCTSNLANLKYIADEPNYTFVKGDICDFDSMVTLFKQYHIDGVVHLAAESEVGGGVRDPFLDVRTVSTQLLFCLPFPDSLSSCHKSKKSIYGK